MQERNSVQSQNGGLTSAARGRKVKEHHVVISRHHELTHEREKLRARPPSLRAACNSTCGGHVKGWIGGATDSGAHTHTHTHTHAYIHVYIHTYIHTYMYTNT